MVGWENMSRVGESLMAARGLGLLDRPSVRQQVRLSQLAEQRGYTSVWVCETRLARDAISVLGALAASTNRLRLCSGVVNTWTRNPALMAMTFATLNNLAPHRMVLGIGAYWDPLAWKQGIDRRRPLAQMREYVHVLRGLLDLEDVTYEGELVKARQLKLDLGHGDERIPQDIPIYIGATGLRAMELAGEIADGVLINGFLSPSYVSTAIERIGVGARRVGRAPEEVRTSLLVNVALSDDASTARTVGRQTLAMYLGQQPHIAKASGLPEEYVERIRSVVGGWPPKPGGLAAARELVTDHIADEHLVAGTPDECRSQMRKWEDTGVDELVILPLTDDYERIIDTFAPGEVPGASTR